jgi:hypothetical protein
MAIKKYIANADNTIVNALQANLVDRGTGSNAGLSDILEVYSIYGQASGSSGLSPELSRAILKFPVTTISTDRTAGTIPASGSVSFYLKVYNARHPEQLPKQYTLDIKAISASSDWEEGEGLDLIEYSDETYDSAGSNWMNIAAGVQWERPGGTYYTDASSSFQQVFTKGTEDLEVDITTLVEQWVNSSGNEAVLGSKANYGVGIHLTSSQEAYYTGAESAGLLHNPTGSQKSYYTKRFFARESEFFYLRPVLEARWNSATKDDRGATYYSSSLAPAADNLNTLYLYNYIRGKLQNIPAVGTGKLLLSLYSGSAADTAPSGSKILLPAGGGVVTALQTNVTGGWVSTGIYSASFAVTAASTPVLTFYDVWHSGGVEFSTGSMKPKTFEAYETIPTDEYICSISNLQPYYNRTQTARFRTYIRKRNWSPTIYTKANSTAENFIVPSASYRVMRMSDNYEVLSYGTGSGNENYTMMSYDVSGNYFDLDMSLFEHGFQYGVKIALYNDSIGTYVEKPYTFKFRVEE